MSRGVVRAAGGRGGELPGYVRVGSPAAMWMARPACAVPLASGAADFLLAGPPARRPRAGGGRGPLVALDLGGQAGLAKRSVHGGLLGRLRGGVYAGSGRMRRQTIAAGRLAEAGIPTPEVLAVGWRRLLGPLQAHAIITRAIPGALNLLEAADSPALRQLRRPVIEEAARVVRAMHDAGFDHADLNITNLVLSDTAGGVRLHVVDLDRGRFVPRLGPARRAANLARLSRSCEKWLAPVLPIGRRDEILFLRKYCGDDRRQFEDLGARLRRRRAWRRVWRPGSGRAPTGGGGARPAGNSPY